MFTVEVRDIEGYKEKLSEVELYIDKEGLSDLIRQLSFLQQKGDHSHFMTPAWGGSELSAQGQGGDTTIINHLRITLV